MCSNAKVTYKNRQKMISKTYKQKEPLKILFIIKEMKKYIYTKNRISLLELWKFTKIVQESEQSLFKNKQESRVSVRRISFMDFNLPYYHFSLL